MFAKKNKNRAERKQKEMLLLEWKWIWKGRAENPQQKQKPKQKGGRLNTIKEWRGVALSGLGHGSVSISVWYLGISVSRSDFLLFSAL